MNTFTNLTTAYPAESLDVVARGPLPVAPAGSITIIEYTPQYKEDFKRLNLEWIEYYFTIEPFDHLVLSDPETYFLHPGGCIFFAQYCGDIVGTCALLKHAERGFELSKMGVTRLYRGMKIGRTLVEIALAKLRSLGEKTIFLETNSTLIPAIHLYTKLGFKKMPFPAGHSERYHRADTYMVLTW